MVQTTEQAGVVPHLGGLEAERLQHRYLGPEHLLLGLLSEGADPVPHGNHPAGRLLRRTGGVLRQRSQRIRAVELMARWRMTVLAGWSRQPMMACSWSQVVGAWLGLTANVVRTWSQSERPNTRQ